MLKCSFASTWISCRAKGATIGCGVSTLVASWMFVGMVWCRVVARCVRLVALLATVAMMIWLVATDIPFWCVRLVVRMLKLSVVA